MIQVLQRLEIAVSRKTCSVKYYCGLICVKSTKSDTLYLALQCSKKYLITTSYEKLHINNFNNFLLYDYSFLGTICTLSAVWGRNRDERGFGRKLQSHQRHTSSALKWSPIQVLIEPIAA